jgi:hypothetical protein
MERLDRNMQRRVWSRVYPNKGMGLTPQQREVLRRCLARSKENLGFYQKMSNHSLYGQAFARLAEETGEQIKMLTQMLQ